MSYLGKRALYNFLIENGFKVPSMKFMRYVRCRGDEIFETILEDTDIELFCVRGCRIYVSLFDSFIDSDWQTKRVETARYAFILDSGKWVKTYERQGKALKLMLEDKK